MERIVQLANIAKPNVHGNRFVELLRPSVKPLPTLPGIVGNRNYRVHANDYAGKASFPNITKPTENAGTEFFRRKLSMVRKVGPATTGIAEPNNNNVSSP